MPYSICLRGTITPEPEAQNRSASKTRARHCNEELTGSGQTIRGEYVIHSIASEGSDLGFREYGCEV